MINKNSKNRFTAGLDGRTLAPKVRIPYRANVWLKNDLEKRKKQWQNKKVWQ